MMNDCSPRPVVVVAADADRGFARIVRAELRCRQLDVWSLADDVMVGESRIAALDRAIDRAHALIYIQSHNAAGDSWVDQQLRAFRVRLKPDGDLKWIVVPRPEIVVEASRLAHAVVLPSWLDPLTAAKTCAAIIRRNDGISTARYEPPADNANAPLISAGAWPLVADLGEAFEQSVNRIVAPASFAGYEELAGIYWQNLHYSGYRGRWEERIVASAHLNRLARNARDYTGQGLILAKGIAYAQLTRGQFCQAKRTLTAASRAFDRARDCRGIGICHSYLGDISARAGEIASALRHYETARRSLRGLEQYEVQLKGRMVATLEDADGTGNLAVLQELREAFAEVQNYRAGVLDVAIARALALRGEYNEALAHVAAAVRLFRDTIVMPRNAAPAIAVHQALVEGCPLPLGGEPW